MTTAIDTGLEFGRSIAALAAFRRAHGHAFAIVEPVTAGGWPRDEVASIRTDSTPDWRDNGGVTLFAGEVHPRVRARER